MTYQRRRRIYWKRGERPIMVKHIVFLLWMRTAQKE
jgi:hypothetical protein